MNVADVGIVGGGLAGSVAAAMLGRAGISTVLIDVHRTYPEDFRVEKIEKKQEDLFEATGFREEVYKAGLLFEEIWLARFGRLIDKRPNEQFGIAYPDLINTIRSLIPPTVRFVVGKVTNVETSGDRQTIVVNNGERWSVRLAIMATGHITNTLREQLSIKRKLLDACHVANVGFDMRPVGSEHFRFPSLTYFGGPKTRIAYIAMFPMRDAMRANIFIYRDVRDPWFADLRKAPVETLCAAFPRFRSMIGPFETSAVVVRPLDLYVTEGYRQQGVVLVGDCFATSSPAVGTGVQRVLTDVTQLCNHHIPGWLASAGMGIEKINQFYDDPVKVDFDQYAHHLAFYLRSLTVDRELRWRIRRLGWFSMQAMQGALRRVRQKKGNQSDGGGVQWGNTQRHSDREYRQSCR